MQDITPPGNADEKPRSRRRHKVAVKPEPAPVPVPAQEIGAPEEHVVEPEMLPERSIRSIQPSANRLRQVPRHDHRIENLSAEPRRRSRVGIWIAVMVALIVLLGAVALVLFPSTSVTVTPHTQQISFDASSPFTAYPEASAAAGTIPYSVLSQVFEDSATVQANGTEEVNEPATGTITVYNSYSDQPVRLIKNTRFQTPDGLIYRIPASVDVPGRNGDAPGSIAITVIADQSGPDYNVGPFDRLTLPGLRSTAAMYEGVYGKSTTAFSGGFSGRRPAVSDSVLEAAKAEVRGRLQEKANQLSATAPEGSVAFSGLVAVSFESLPPTEESGGTVRINERATVSVPVFPEARLAQSIGQAVSANAEGQSVSIRFADDLAAAPVGALSAADLGSQPVSFTLAGRGQLVWNVDPEALAGALSTRSEGAFETIIQGFPSIEEARARIMPFWRRSFPDASNIKVTVEPPAAF